VYAKTSPARAPRAALPKRAQCHGRRPLRGPEALFQREFFYNPDNGVTANFMPHLWMFLLQALTPAEHEVLRIDGNTQRMSDAKIVAGPTASSLAAIR
jgi:hypothetical protein